MIVTYIIPGKNLHYYEDYKYKTMQFMRIKLIFLRKLRLSQKHRNSQTSSKKSACNTIRNDARKAQAV